MPSTPPSNSPRKAAKSTAKSAAKHARERAGDGANAAGGGSNRTEGGLGRGAVTGALELSRWAQRQLTARPALQAELAPDAPAWTAATMREALPVAPPADEAALKVALRRLRQRVMLRVMERDLSGRADLAEVCATMTALAEVATDATLGLLVPQLAADYGEPRGVDGSRQELIVVGMGKLGGGELNVSSDIDLVFVYPEDGDAVFPSGRGPDRPASQALSNHEWFGRLGKRFITCLDEVTDEGRVFRVDMRLRPWGDAGPLAMSFDGLEQYLVAQGREWERYAWIKGRALSGDQTGALAGLVRPFVFRKYLDYGAFAAMRELHAQIRAEVARRELADHIKLGPGGIREIEFIAQAFQLIRGGRELALQARPTLTVLALLAERHLLPAEVEAELRAAYVFLRRLEHRLQYVEDAQTHQLPVDAAERTLIAAAMGFAGWPAFSAALSRHREQVSRHFEEVFATQTQSRHALAPLWSGPDGADTRKDDMAKALKALGYREPGATAARLAAARSGSRYAQLPAGSRDRFDSLVPRLIASSARLPDPDETLARALTLMETVSRRAAYLALLDEHPETLDRLCELLGASSWGAEYLNRHPVLLDELIDRRQLLQAPDWSEIGCTLRSALIDAGGDQERQMDLLRETHHAQVFRMLAQDLAGMLSVERHADYLSELADLMLQVALEICWTQLRARHRDFPRFAIIGYGKLGGKELGYASDLDIIFVYDDDDDAAPEVYARLAQRINNWLTSRTPAGVLFETDLRLRPDGASGLLVSSIEAFRRYQLESAWIWEHQALTRARYCAGEANTGAAFEAVRREVLSAARDENKLRHEVVAMRKTLLAGHPNASDRFDLKHDRGGMVDIEFLVQYLVLAHAGRHAMLLRNDGNIALLQYAAELGLIPAQSAAAVADAYREYRRLQHGLRMAGERYARVPRATVRTHLEATRALWRSVFGTD